MDWILEVLITRKNKFVITDGVDVNWTYCGDHFAIYTNIESLCNVMTIVPQ